MRKEGDADRGDKCTGSNKIQESKEEKGKGANKGDGVAGKPAGELMTITRREVMRWRGRM